ncbi:MAG: O-methyltransferase [Bryobacteraceae bacterium]
MRRFALVALALFFALSITAQRRGGPGRRGIQDVQALAANDAEKRILDAIRTADQFANVPPEDGRMLRLLAETAGAKNVVEIGTSTGISGMWIALALQKTGGTLTTFEIDPGRAASARESFRKAGVDRIVTVVEGDAHQNLGRVKGPVDLVFIDAEKEGYVDYLNKLLPLVRPGGVFAAHNIDMAREYLDAVSKNPALDTILFGQGSGMGITLKKRY